MTSPNVIAALTDAILTDDVNQSRRLIALYEGGDTAKKEFIDEILIILCGYSLPTLITMAEVGESC